MKFINFWFTVPVPAIALIIIIALSIIYLSAVFIKGRMDSKENRGYMPRYKAPKIKLSKIRKNKR